MVVSLVAALMLLTFVSAAGVSERQPGFGSDNPKVISCAQSDVCVQAASFWRDCQTAQPNFLVAEPGAGTRQCLCNPQTATPDHAEDWWKKLNACVQCVEEPLGDDIGSSSGALDGLRQDFCNRVFSKGHFIQHAQHLQQASEFPLRLPEAILSNSNAAKGAARRAGDGAYLPGTQAFSQIAHVYTTPSITTAMVTQTVVPIKCNHDNCLRSFMRAGSPAISFCSEYTTNSALTSSSYRLPDYAMSCWGNNYSRISSACTCLNEIATETSTSAKTTDGITTPKSSTPTSAGYTKQTQSSGKSFSISSTSTADSYGQEPSSSDKSTSMTSTPTLNPSAHYTRTTTITSWTTIYSTSTGSSTPTSFHNITSTTSPLTKTETPSSSYTDHVNTTSYTAKASSYTTSGTSSTTTPAATKGSSGGWITLPASDAMVKCSKSEACHDAGEIFKTCTKWLSPQATLTTQECLCAPLTFADWNRTTSTCSDCIAAALPVVNPANEYPPTNLTNIIQFSTNRYCTIGLVPLDRLVKAGQIITSAFQSPILYFNMTMVDSPIAATGSTSDAKPRIVMEPNLVADLQAALSI